MIGYILEPLRKSAGDFTNKTASVFETSTPKQTMYGRGKKLSKTKPQSKTYDIRYHFILKKKKGN